MANFIFPQQVELNYLIPSLRKELAVAMKNLGLSQREIANRLILTEAAVSQYFNEKRAGTVKFNDNILSNIKEVAKTINNKNFHVEMHNLVKLSLHENVTCGVCIDVAHTSNTCKVCFEK